MYTTQSTPVRPTPGVEAFTPVQLLRLTQLFASDPALADTLGPDPERPGERSWRLLADSPQLQVWLIRKPLGGSHLHDVANLGREVAVSLHAYSPTLAQMTHDDLVDGALRPSGVEQRPAW